MLIIGNVKFEEFRFFFDFGLYFSIVYNILFYWLIVIVNIGFNSL